MLVVLVTSGNEIFIVPNHYPHSTNSQDNFSHEQDLEKSLSPLHLPNLFIWMCTYENTSGTGFGAQDTHRKYLRDKFEVVDRPEDVERAWRRAYESSKTSCAHYNCKYKLGPQHCQYGKRIAKHHVVTGSILQNWRVVIKACGSRMKIVRMQTDEGERIVSRLQWFLDLFMFLSNDWEIPRTYACHVVLTSYNIVHGGKRWRK